MELLILLVTVFLQVLIAIGISGACRRDELWKLTLDNLQDLGSALLVTLPSTKTKIVRKFTVTGNFYDIYKKYAMLRPSNVESRRLFVNYQNGKCTKQLIGINKIGATAKLIATFLKLPNPELYTGHCFRRSSATILVNSGSDLLTLKRHGGWRSSSVAEGYIDDSMASKINISNQILQAVNPVETPPPLMRNKSMEMDDFGHASPHSSTSTNITFTENLLKRNEVPGISFQNCSHININYNFK